MAVLILFSWIYYRSNSNPYTGKKKLTSIRVTCVTPTVETLILYKKRNYSNYSWNKNSTVPSRGNQGCIQAWIGTVSVIGFHSSTSCCIRGRASWSRMLSSIHGGTNGSHCSRNSISGSHVRQFQLLKKKECVGKNVHITATVLVIPTYLPLVHD
jgi:hypothetical protein